MKTILIVQIRKTFQVLPVIVCPLTPCRATMKKPKLQVAEIT